MITGNWFTLHIFHVWRRTQLFHHPLIHHNFVLQSVFFTIYPFNLISSKHNPPHILLSLSHSNLFYFVFLSIWSHKHFQIRPNQVLVSFWVNLIVLGSFKCFKSVLSHSSLVRVFKFSFCVFKSIYIRLAPLVNPRLERSLLTSLLQLSQIGFNLCVK